ncbi:hemolysin family protein [Terriglobus roseus]|uniref:Hemolysin, contains CBS domains n=1 Tax=Terriglobus roseus TaxID=392734 RepID=A0A1H4KEH3_9BACT|nr:hemolysin family protein [Terriglobus roseus]SEB56515.1 Hemolysin, contains CBS domains [Terriglobus roseus]
MNFLSVLLIAGLLFVLTVASYADRVYSEMGKFLAREYQDNLDAWVDGIEPRFGLSRDSVALSASILRQTSLASIALILGVRRFTSATNSTWVLYAETLAELALIIILFDRMLPQVLFARTRGEWVSRIRYVLQALFYIVLPITLFLGLLLSIASLAEHDSEATEDHPDEGVDALLEAGEEEGILEESDRALVRSVVEFGDMVVREVMTPRPEMFAVHDTMTLAEFTTVLQGNAFSRVPVYHGTVDEITGIAFAHDLLQVADTDAGNLTVREMQRPAAFVPEPKKVNELLREMQSEKQHMRIVIDEYGTVAGLVTIEDLIEAIVGNIEDEHDEDTEAIREDDGAYIVPGSMDVTHLRDLLSKANDEDEREPLRLRTDLEASTVGGLVSELAGHIPLPGEVIEADGLHIDVLSATSRLVTRVRVRTLPPPDPSED